ncbi:methyltransferase domain-containing protein [Taylorella equigenitalis]|uniref:methyltransferase domain-containing protein n=1 Tax=Taylorella equigenitalis TaxID=29575 RepID=UPI00237DAAF8|nr:methyltransferase domain-containing protein [Taylorella equigenitalis]WDU52217.1 methyltransferase domain-containing protein [Taylorella equigenitalis]
MSHNRYYDQEGLWKRDLTSQEIERIEIVKKFIPSDVKTILDAGCGNGAISNYLNGYDITGMDRSPEALKYVTNKTVEGSLDSIPFEDNAFDLIICADVLEHLSEEVFEKTIKEFKRVSKKYILIISPNAEDLTANQSKCYSCDTVFHMNWHIRSLNLRDTISNFRDDFAPIYFSFFGEKWSSEPELKYKQARTSGRGYKHWENAVCPLCGTSQFSLIEDNKDIDEETNPYLNGFYNLSTEFILLLSTIEHKKTLCDFDSLEDRAILTKNNYEDIYYVNRQCILTEKNIFLKNNTEHYPQFSYILNNSDSAEKNRLVFCLPYKTNLRKLYINYLDNVEAELSINVYDLKNSFINIGSISLSNSLNLGTASFELPEVTPPNEGYLFEVISSSESINFKTSLKEIFFDKHFGKLNLNPIERRNFLGIDYTHYEPLGLNLSDGQFLLLEKEDCIFDKSNKCFFLNLDNTFEFFNGKSSQSQGHVPFLNDKLTREFQEDRFNEFKNFSNLLLDSIETKVEEYQANRDVQFNEFKSFSNSLLDSLDSKVEEFQDNREVKLNEFKTLSSSLLDSIEIKVEEFHENQEGQLYELRNLSDSLLNSLEIKVEALHENLFGEVYKSSHDYFKLVHESFNELQNQHLNELKQFEDKYTELKEEIFSEDQKLTAFEKHLFDKVDQEIYQIKAGLYNVSNSHERLVKALRNPFTHFMRRFKPNRKAQKSINLPTINGDTKELISLHSQPSLKYLVVITPDVHVDRRTVQMCQSLIDNKNIRCTIIAALQDEDNFVTDRLKVKRVDPVKSDKYILKPDDWRDGSYLNLEDFYWLHPHYLNAALLEDADYIMCCDLPLLPAAVYVSKIKGIPLIYDAHELYPEQSMFSEETRNFYSQVEAHFIKFPNLTITVNESIAEEMSARYGIQKPKVILNALNPPANFDIDVSYNHFRDALPIKPNQKIVLFQGGFSQNRNLELLVKSANHIPLEDVVLVLMGFGEYGEKLMSLAKNEGTLNKTVFFYPAVDQSVLLEYSASADVGIIPYPHTDLNSYYCTPNKLFEFIQAGIPIIANDSPELNRFIVNQKIGITRPINDEVDIANLITEFFKSGYDYSENLKVARTKFNWNEEESKFTSFINGIIL